jgi:DNA primase
MLDYSISDILSRVFNHSPAIQKSGDELLFFCPKCNHHKKKLNVNVKNGFYHCWICDFKGKGFISLLKRLNASREYFSYFKEYKYDNNLKKESDAELVLPSEFIPMYKKSKNIHYRNMLNYCLNRGLSHTEMIRYNVGYCLEGEFANQIIFPSYDKDQKLNFYCSRNIYESFKKYQLCNHSKNMIGFESLINFKHQITLVEGVFDAISVRYNVTPLFGTNMSDILKIKILTVRPPRVNVLLDNDALHKSLYICDFLIQNNINVHLIELDKKDPNELGFKKTWEFINNSVRFTESDLFRYKVIYKNAHIKKYK